MCKRVIDLSLLTGHRKGILLGHVFSHSIRLVLALFCCQFIIAAHCKTDLKYSHPDISWLLLFFFPLVARQGQERLLPCLVSLLCSNGSKLKYDLKLIIFLLSNPWWEWDGSINSHVKNFYQHAQDLKKILIWISVCPSVKELSNCASPRQLKLYVLMSHP